MLNLNHLRHLTMRGKLHGAMMRSIKGSRQNDGFSSTVKNRKGEVVIRVTHTRGIGGGLKFSDKKGNDITSMIKLSLRETE